MRETVILVHDRGKSKAYQISQDSISELARHLLSDKSIVGILFYDRLREAGPPPAPKDKGGESQ